MAQDGGLSGRGWRAAWLIVLRANGAGDAISMRINSPVCAACSWSIHIPTALFTHLRAARRVASAFTSFLLLAASKIMAESSESAAPSFSQRDRRSAGAFADDIQQLMPMSSALEGVAPRRPSRRARASERATC